MAAPRSPTMEVFQCMYAYDAGVIGTVGPSWCYPPRIRCMGLWVASMSFMTMWAGQVVSRGVSTAGIHHQLDTDDLTPSTDT